MPPYAFRRCHYFCCHIDAPLRWRQRHFSPDAAFRHCHFRFLFFAAADAIATMLPRHYFAGFQSYAF